MSDNANTPPERPEYDKLVFELRALMCDREQAGIEKAEVARRTGVEVMRKAAALFAAGKISGTDLTRLHAMRMRLDAAIPLPSDLPPALRPSDLRPVEGRE